MYIGYDPLTALSIRTVAEIQEKVIEKGGRNLLSRLVHAKNDKETMVTWRSDLNRVLLVFNVCSMASILQSLTPLPQTELTIGTHAMVSDLHRNASTVQEGTDGPPRSVSMTFHLLIIESSPRPRLKPGQQS